MDYPESTFFCDAARLLGHPMLRRILALAFTLISTIALVQSSGHPIIGEPAPPGPPDLPREILLTIGHIITFSALVVLWWWALVPNLPWRRALFVAVSFALVTGMLTEVAQSLVPDREVSALDLAANWVSSLLTARFLNSRHF